MSVEIIIAGIIGGLTFGLLLLFVAAYFVEKFAFRQHPPAARSFWTTFIAWLIVGGLWAFSLSGLAPFLLMLPPALIHFWWYKRSLQKRWDEGHEHEVFD